jgi:hypothetical protein
LKKIKSISAVLLALLVFVSTNSFAVNMHFCGENLIDYSVASKAEACAMHNPESTQKPDNCDLTKKDCCKDVQKVVQGQDELSKTQKTEIAPQYINFLSAYFISYAELFQPTQKNVSNFNFYSPPLLVHDIQLLDEVYLI